MQESLQQLGPKITMIEAGVSIGFAFLIVDKIINWVVKLKTKNGNGEGKKALNIEEFCREMEAVAKVHDKMTSSIESQTLVLDRIYHGQELQIKALDRIVEKLYSK